MCKEIFSNDVTLNIKRWCDNDFYDHYSTEFYDSLDLAKAKTNEVAKEAMASYAESEGIAVDDFLVKTDDFGNIIAEFSDKAVSIKIEVDVRSYTLFSH